MTVSAILWVLDGLLLAIAVVNAREVIPARGPRARKHRAETLRTGLASLSARPSAEELRGRWVDVLGEESPAGRATAALVDIVNLVAAAHPDDVDALRATCRDSVNAYNKLATWVDDGLVRPKDVARAYSREHLLIIEELTLVEPFIWYESLVGGLGRWGYRVLALRDALVGVRCASPRSAASSRITVVVGGVQFLQLQPVPWPIAHIKRMLLKIKSPTIDVHKKVAQNKQAAQLASVLLTASTGNESSRRAVPW